ncbi:RNA 2',3'-cyclic phosphodiesterase [Cohnella sp. AR92]|uniref:RNA 2',3'-cyclic phosphodiesterase n=1 Tax=Cohnella sp. AR92 TaxID=648716 RepID=UPI000F8E1233|nr:RNA 2',3'-cyclic phosphodiesterase [Cohnella sp. AR92]RUS48605.1 RNA 2',3'-cyclic phosphodiesterase [Cohnella sp. AR92]
MRLFTAIPIPQDVIVPLNQWVQARKDELAFRKWTHPQDYHITLQFLGEVAEERVDELNAALEHILFTPLSLGLNGGGTFGAPRAPSVLYAGLRGELERLAMLQAAIVRATEPLGFAAEKRPYSPHLTLARRFASEDGSAFPRGLLDTMPSDLAWTADRFVLMKTHLNASPMYERIREYQ